MISNSSDRKNYCGKQKNIDINTCEKHNQQKYNSVQFDKSNKKKKEIYYQIKSDESNSISFSYE